MRSSKALLIVIFLFTICSGWATSLYVDINSTAISPDGSEQHPFANVNAAVTQAWEDATVDDIVILPGVYNENIELIGFLRNLNFRSTYNPDLGNDEVIQSTVIRGMDQSYDPVFYIKNCAANATISFYGLSITNGKGHFVESQVNPENWTMGGGICVIGTASLEQHVSMKWCDVYENYACWGGGIYGLYASIVVSNTNIHDNALYFLHSVLPPDTHGGGLVNGSKGAGVYLAGGYSTISHCKIYSNRSFLDQEHELYNPLCYGNAAALVWRNTCAVNDIGLIMEYCEVFDNVTKTINDQMATFDWPFRTTIQIQRGLHVIVPGESGYNHVEINQCTITDNRIIEESSVFSPYVNCAVGILRLTDEEHIRGTINNNIIYDNTSGTNLFNQNTTQIQQLYGGSFNNQGVFIPIMIPIRFCCVNDAHDSNIYNDEGDGSIDLDPLFVSSYESSYNLRWDTVAVSPCIDRGNPEVLDELDLTPIDMGARPYLIAHDYDRYTMPEPGSTVPKWMCFPVLNDITTDACVNEVFFEPIVDIDILDYVMYKPFQQASIHEMRHSGGELILGNEIVNSHQGYKVLLQEDCPDLISIHTPGSLIPPETVLDLHSYGSYGDNWVGYFQRESAKPLDALAAVLDHVYRIETQRWTMIKQPNGSWIHAKSFVLNYGDLVILYSDQDCSFSWNNPNPVRPFTLSTPTAFSYDGKSSYTPFYVTLPQSKDAELPAEIGLYVNDICKGAVVVEDSLLHICAYLDEGEEITPENSFLVFYYPSKSGASTKKIYRMDSKQLQMSKNTNPYYFLAISDPQNCTSVSPLVGLKQNYPNPFNPTTNISYDLPEDGDVRLSVYNLKGQLVKQLLNKRDSLGPHTVVWDGKDSRGNKCSSGVYYYRLTTGGKSLTKKMLMLK